MLWQVWCEERGFRFDPSGEAEAGPAPDEVVLEFRAGGICGTDLGDLAHRVSSTVSGWPLHEVVGEVIHAGSSGFSSGDLVVGWAAEARGLRQTLTVSPERVVALPPALAADPVRAIVAQPLATVLSACDRIGEMRGARAVVLGTGSIGLLFVAELARRGATVTAVDLIDRSERALAYGAASFVQADARFMERDTVGAFDLVIEAIGHDTVVQANAVDLVDETGTLFLFGVPDDDELTISFKAAFFRSVRILAGITTRHTTFLLQAIDRLVLEPDFAADYVTGIYSPADADAAYKEAARSAEDRVKVVLVG